MGFCILEPSFVRVIFKTYKHQLVTPIMLIIDWMTSKMILKSHVKDFEVDEIRL